jgi:ribosomal protein L13
VVEIAKTEQPVVVDAAQQVAGRIASKIAKLLIEGRHVVVLNAETSLMSGSKKKYICRIYAKKGTKKYCKSNQCTSSSKTTKYDSKQDD